MYKKDVNGNILKERDIVKIFYNDGSFKYAEIEMIPAYRELKRVDNELIPMPDHLIASAGRYIKLVPLEKNDGRG